MRCLIDKIFAALNRVRYIDEPVSCLLSSWLSTPCRHFSTPVLLTFPDEYWYYLAFPPKGVSLHPLFGQLADGFPSVGPAPISLSWKDPDSFYFFCSAVYHMSSFPIFSCQYIPRIVSRRLCRKKNSYCSAWKTNYQMFHL